MVEKNSRLDHNCIHEEQLQNHNLKIGQLETKAAYKEEAIVELKNNMKIMNEKLDDVVETLNEIKLQSNSDDKELELRLKAIETRQEAQETAREQDNQKYMRLLSAITLIFAALTFYFNFMK